MRRLFRCAILALPCLTSCLSGRVILGQAPEQPPRKLKVSKDFGLGMKQFLESQPLTTESPLVSQTIRSGISPDVLVGVRSQLTRQGITFTSGKELPTYFNHLAQYDCSVINDNYVIVTPPTNVRITFPPGTTPSSPIVGPGRSNPDDVFGVKAFWRPALLVTGDHIDVSVEMVPDLAPDHWAVVLQSTAVRANISRSLRATGRLFWRNSLEYPADEVVGTAFMVHKKYALTNGHIVDNFRKDACNNGQEPDIVLGFGGFFDNPKAPDTLVRVKVAYRSSVADFAILELVGNEASTILPLTETKPSLPAPRKVWVCGYPTKDTESMPTDIVDMIFKRPLGTKRLSPGECNTLGDDVCIHDCSTMAGNSGSPVIDLKTGSVLGIHFQGGYRQRNEAVASWRILADANARSLLSSNP
jgi:hypothetical protein